MKYDYLDKIYNKMLKTANHIIKNGGDYEHDCGGRKECASCLSVYARMKHDKELSFAEGDILMMDLRNDIADKHKNWYIN